MGQSALLVDRESKESRNGLSPLPGFEKLQELTRHGYLPDPTPHGDGILLRHPAGPDLVLRPDGTIDLPTGQSAGKAASVPSRFNKRISWQRTFLFMLILMIGIFAGWVMTALVFSS
jgi:hypothetical protein